MKSEFPLKIGDLIRLTDEWIKWAEKEFDGFDDLHRRGKGVIYKVVGVTEQNEDSYHVSFNSKTGDTRAADFNKDLVCLFNKYGSMPMIELCKEKIVLETYNTKCPVCGSPAFDMAFAVECSNPECQNRKH